MVRALLLSLLALSVPVAGVYWFPEELADYEALTWLLALIPAFLLAYHRGWRGVAVALAMGMAALSVTYAVAESLGRDIPSLLFGVVPAYLVILLGIGWLADRLSKHRGSALAEDGVLDPLTGLPNREHAEAFLEREFGAALSGKPLAVVLFDLDRFREFNARNGEAAGNGVLRAFATLLRQNTRRLNLASRWGPEEFLCVLVGASQEGAIVFAERIQERLRAAGSMATLPTVSAGVATYDSGFHTAQELLEAAEAAMLRAKSDGRDRVRLHGTAGAPVVTEAAREAEVQADTDAPIGDPQPRTPRKAFVYVTDNAVRKELVSHLSDRGIEVTEGASVAERLLPFETEYHVVAIELAPPYGPLRDVVREVRARSPATRIVGVPQTEQRHVPAALLTIPVDAYYLPVENGTSFEPPLPELLAERDRLYAATQRTRDLRNELRAQDRELRKALAGSEEKYLALVDTAQEVIFQTDAEARFTFLNAAWTVISGHPIEHSLDRSLFDYLDASDRDRLETQFRELVAGSRAYIMLETRLVPRTGEARWIEGRIQRVRTATGESSGAAGRLFDITARRTAEDALRRSEARFRALTEHTADIMALIEPNGTLRYVSPAVEHILGFPAADREGRNSFDLVHPEDVEAAREALADVAREPGRQRTARIRAIHRNGEWRLLETTVRNLIEVPEVGGIVVNARDITERRAAERALSDAEAMLARSRQMDTIGRLAGGLAHEFNNLLTTIRGHADLARDAMQESEPGRADLLAIDAAARRATALTRQFLAFGRRQVTRAERLDLNAVLGDMRKIVTRLLEPEMKVTLELGADPPTVDVDPAQIEQVVLNLTVHARETMGRTGRLTVSTWNAHVPEAEAAAGGPAAGDYVVLSIGDTGPGLDPAQIDHLFDPFSSLRGPATGEGFGLSSVYGIVKQIGGDVIVTSRTGEDGEETGTTFTIYLPGAGQPDDADTRSADPAKARAGGETIVVAEDDKAVRELAERILVREGYRVLTASNGRQALNAVARHPGRIDLLVADVVMPEIDGRDLADRVTVMRPGVRVLFISGHVEDLVGHHGVFAGGSGFLEKPFPPDKLLQRVRELLDAPVPPPA
jgi:diguanylate cyclase (GGDEF)-like protein/PAS domain S-box-containing protein